MISSGSHMQRCPTARAFIEIATAFDENFCQRRIIATRGNEEDCFVELISSFVLDTSFQEHRGDIFVTFPNSFEREGEVFE